MKPCWRHCTARAIQPEAASRTAAEGAPNSSFARRLAYLCTKNGAACLLMTCSFAGLSYNSRIRSSLKCDSSRDLLFTQDPRLTGSFADPRAEDQVMSFMVWKLLRLLPKPVILILLFFLLGAIARA